MKENNNNTIYKYSQLYDILLEKILANEWKANDKMPTERELSIRYNVSRVTVRDTLNRLAQAGYIYRIQGKGTFVSVRKIEKKLTKLYTLRKRFEEKGVVHEVKTLQFEVISPSDDIREKLEIIESNEFQNLFDKSKKLIDSARSNMGQMANAITVLTSFLLGRYIIEQEQQGSERAKYGAKVLDSLSSYLTEEYGRGFSRSNVAGMRQFYMAYKDREDEIIQSGIGQFERAFGIVQSGIGQLETAYKKIPFKLSWTHYQILMRIEDKDERDFYEKEVIRSNWNVSTLKRQFHSSLYERLALSRDKNDVMRLANEGAVPQKPEDILHTPYVLEFAGLEDKAAYHESDLESAVIGKMQKFLLELGKGFLFEQRQKRFTFNDKNFYVDLVLYNRLLRCYVLIDFKIDELTHQDLGQMQMYVNYYDRYEKIEGENPTIGILLCKQSDEALVDLTLPENANIYAKEYKLYLPDKKLLQKKLKEWLDEEQN